MINSYKFGVININGKTYMKDVIIIGDEVFHPWWRREGHRVYPEDLKYPLEKNVNKIVIGTGYWNRVTIPEETKNFLKDNGIEFIFLGTKEAVDMYNNDKEKTSTAYCLHLTC